MRRFLAVALLIVAPSCAGTYASRGGLIGGALGAGTGAIIGAQTGAAAPGAIIGAGIGLVSGALIGGGLDEVEAKSRAPEPIRYETRYVEPPPPPPPPPHEPPLDHDGVIRLAQSGVSDRVIVAKIRSSPHAFRVTVEDVLVLREAGVSDAVIDAMISHRPAPRVVVETRRHVHSAWCGCPRY